MKEYVSTSDAPLPAGHYSQAVRSGGLLFISGQLPTVPRESTSPITDERLFKEQARQAISNMLAILRHAGGDPSHLVKVTLYLVGIENWPALNELYAELLGSARPARSIVPVPALHFGYLVEVEAIASGL